MIQMKEKASFALKLLVVAFVAIFGLQAQSDTAPSEYECRYAWTQSGASNSCGEDNSVVFSNGSVSAGVDTWSYSVHASDGKCSVEVDCLKSDTSVLPVANTFSGTTSQVQSLNNCDGSLKEGDC